MKHRKLSYHILSLLLSTAAASLCSCNKNPMSAMASEVSDTNQKGIKRYINSDGGLGEVVVNDAWSVQEKLRQCRDKERSLSVDLQLVSKSLQLEKEHSNKYQTSLHGCEVARQLSNDIRSSCQKKNERCERRLEELESNSTTIQGHFKSQIADLESQIVNLTTKHTEYITTLNKSQVEKASAITAQRDDLRTRLENEKNQTESLKKKYSMCVDGIDAETNRRLTKEINTLTALNDDLSTQLAAQGKEAESCRDNYDKGHARELTQLGPLVKLGGGGFLLGAVGIGGFVWKRMSNNLKQEKKERAELEKKIRETSVESEKDVLLGRVRSSVASQGSRGHHPVSAGLSLYSGLGSASARREGRENARMLESSNEDEE